MVGINSNRFLLYGLVGSVFIHCALLFLVSVATLKDFPRALKKMEISYKEIKTKPVPAISAETHKDVKLIRDIASKNIKILSKKFNDPVLSGDIKDITRIKSEKGIAIGSKVTRAVKIGEFEKKIIIPLPQSDKISNTKYLQYQNIIRSKIQSVADLYADSLDLRNGEIYVTFILGADGRLKDLKVLDYRSSANDRQKELGRRFIREADPFPVFPREYAAFPELPFNITISFQVKKIN